MKATSTKPATTSERVSNYAQLIQQIDNMPERGPVKCPVDGCNHKAAKRHGLRVHMARKHSGKSWGRPFTVNAKGKAKKAVMKMKRKTRGTKNPGSAVETAHGMNFCPCCGFSLAVLRAAMSVAGGGR